MPTVSEFQFEFYNDIVKLLRDSDTHDSVIRVGKEKREFRAHRVILCARSSYFRTVLSPQWVKKQNGEFILAIPNILPDIFEIILDGSINLEVHEDADILKLLVAADELRLDNLATYIQMYLIKKRTQLIRNDPVQILKIFLQHPKFTNLHDFCLETIRESPKLLFASDNFFSLDETHFELILERGNLLIEEIEIWDNLVKWGIAQHPNLSNDVSQWSSYDFRNIATTLQKFLPLINWSQIASREFQQKVMPYKDILPRMLYENIINHYLNPDIPVRVSLPARSSNPSTRLNRNFTLPSRNSSLRPTRFDSTIVNSKIAANISSAQVGRINLPNHATYNDINYGPSFGGSYDFYIKGNNWGSDSTEHYPGVTFHNIRSGHLQEYEVYQ
ncbi:12541_t:CDS:2, partial [Ambispora leptoticha]